MVPKCASQIQDLEKIEKLPYLHNRVTDFDEIWHIDAPGTSTAKILLVHIKRICKCKNNK